VGGEGSARRGSSEVFGDGAGEVFLVTAPTTRVHLSSAPWTNTVGMLRMPLDWRYGISSVLSLSNLQLAFALLGDLINDRGDPCGKGPHHAPRRPDQHRHITLEAHPARKKHR